MTADSLSEGPAGNSQRTQILNLKFRNCRKNPSAGTREKPSEFHWSKGGSVCIRKHTGRRDIGASQKRGDRPALRATAPTQRGLRTLLSLRSCLAEGRVGRNLGKGYSSRQHPPVISLQYPKSKLVNCVQFSSTWMSPVE